MNFTVLRFGLIKGHFEEHGMTRTREDTCNHLFMGEVTCRMYKELQINKSKGKQPYRK